MWSIKFILRGIMERIQNSRHHDDDIPIFIEEDDFTK